MFGTCPFLEIWSEPLAILSNRNFQSPLFFRANTLYFVQLNYFYNKENLKKTFRDKCHKLLKLEINMQNM